MKEHRIPFTKMVKIVNKLNRESERAARLDAGFDAGEFSRYEHARLLAESIATALEENGWSEVEFLSKLYKKGGA